MRIRGEENKEAVFKAGKRITVAEYCGERIKLKIFFDVSVRPPIDTFEGMPRAETQPGDVRARSEDSYNEKYFRRRNY